MTAAIRSPDSPRSRAARKPAASPANNKVTSIARARQAKTGPVLPNYSPADDEQAMAQARPGASVLKVLPDRQRQPVWLRSLLRMQRASTAAAVLLLGGALSVYGLTVYSEQRWSQEYQKLETLRLREQQLSAASEVLKHQLAQEAQNPESGLVRQNPADTIFLRPALEQRPQTAPNSEPALKNRSGVETPLGY
ncbi:hypothetical protein QUB68_14465 [Microcoleus sp. A006_D1]|uniref:hypothetical protein n=1 Tax=Microcoleus sp. A006_D1 TaxID=3055267 RepID=UPI002FD089C8